MEKHKSDEEWERYLDYVALKNPDFGSLEDYKHLCRVLHDTLMAERERHNYIANKLQMVYNIVNG